MTNYNYKLDISNDDIEKTKKYTDALNELKKAVIGVNSKFPEFSDGLKEGIKAIGEKLPEVVDADYQFDFATLLQFINSGLNAGANLTFGPVLPQNTSGKNGDVFINTNAGSFAQKIAGVWTGVYTRSYPAIGLHL